MDSLFGINILEMIEFSDFLSVTMTSLQNAFSGLWSAYKCYGLSKTVRMVFLTMGTPKIGRIAGTDAMGNEYYENRNDVSGRDRWVIFKKWDHDASQVPPHWHQWMSHMTDDIPTEQSLPTPFYTPTTFQENLTGTSGAFKTYSTTGPKILSWEPKVAKRNQ